MKRNFGIPNPEAPMDDASGDYPHHFAPEPIGRPKSSDPAQMWLAALILIAALGMVVYSCTTRAAEINPDAPSDPLNKIFFGVRTHPENGPPRSMQIEVDTVQECIDHVMQALAKKVGDTDKANEVRCIKERNAEKPS